MTEKIIGYTLLVTGILVIFYAGISTYSVFTKKSEPVKLFNFKSIGLDTNQILAGALPPDAAGLMQQNAKPNQTEIISADIINDTSNIFSYLFLMGFIASIGYKLASLGIMLIRPIVVKLKEKEEVPATVSQK